MDQASLPQARWLYMNEVFSFEKAINLFVVFMFYHYYTTNVLFNTKNKKGNYRLPAARVHSFKSY
jgi:hypothetical protein